MLKHHQHGCKLFLQSEVIHESLPFLCPAHRVYVSRHFQRQDSKSAVRTVTAEDGVCTVYACSSAEVPVCPGVIVCLCVCVAGLGVVSEACRRDRDSSRLTAAYRRTGCDLMRYQQPCV